METIGGDIIKLICLLGPSGSGKTTIARYMKEELEFVEIVTSTTREPREGEIDGITYYYVDEDEFDELNKIEEVEYSGNKYGFTKKEVDYKLNNFDKVLCIVDRHGIEQLKKIYGDIIKVVYVYSNPTECFERLKRRDDLMKAMYRITYANNNGEFKNHDIADHVLENEDGKLYMIKNDIKDIIEIENDG